MNVIEPTKEQLNHFVLENHGNFQQSWQWGDLQEEMDRAVRRFLFADAAATFVRHDLPLGKYYWLCPKGPVGRIENSEWRMEEVAKKLGGIFIRIEPQVLPPFPIRHSLFKSPKDHNPRATAIINLSRSEAELLAMMHPKTRYNLRLAQKKALNFQFSIFNFQDFLNLMRKTARRDKFYLHPKEYYEKLSEMPEIKIFGIYHEDELIATAAVSFWGDTATYLHGASDYEHRALMAPYLLHWEIMKDAKAAGMKHYDFGGIAPKSEPDHYLAGVTRFKSGWGGEYVEYPGSYDYVIEPSWYKIYWLARKIL